MEQTIASPFAGGLAETVFPMLCQHRSPCAITPMVGLAKQAEEETKRKTKKEEPCTGKAATRTVTGPGIGPVTAPGSGV